VFERQGEPWTLSALQKVDIASIAYVYVGGCADTQRSCKEGFLGVMI
jgi:hypothetical protein